MSKLTIERKGDILTIQNNRVHMRDKDTEEVQVSGLFLNRRVISYVNTYEKPSKNRVLYWEEFDEIESIEGTTRDVVLLVSLVDGIIRYGLYEKKAAYNQFLQFPYYVLKIGFSHGKLKLVMISYLVNTLKDFDVEDICFYIDDNNKAPLNMKVYPKLMSRIKAILKLHICSASIPLDGLMSDETELTNSVDLAFKINNFPVTFRIGKRVNGYNSRRYFAPYKSCFYKGYAFHLRRTDRGNFALVKRPMEDIEKTARFRFYESKPVSYIMYHFGLFRKKHSKKKVNLFYEKFASKAEEGTFDLFKFASSKKTSNNYFIIDENSADYPKIASEKNVVKKFSPQYYRLLYRATAYISTEAPAHLNIIRSNNRYFRLSTCDNPFIFLQHGVTYMKCQGESSTFHHGREGEPKYMVVGSQKEREAVCDMLLLDEGHVWNTGLPIFDLIEYNHINDKSDDIALIMLTWKSYEEQIESFENSEYYKNVICAYELLCKYLPPENIRIVPHPRMMELCKNTSLYDKFWTRPISEALPSAKLLITDYSSVCYNTFYQGGGVIFFQPDLAKYEAESGKLVPDDDEYIGRRCFSEDELKTAIDDVINDGKINLDVLRKPEYVENYNLINEHHDGKNIERIAQLLEKKEII